jgi:hypothetical protein
VNWEQKRPGRAEAAARQQRVGLKLVADKQDQSVIEYLHLPFTVHQLPFTAHRFSTNVFFDSCIALRARSTASAASGGM